MASTEENVSDCCAQGLHSRLAEFLSGGCEHGPCAE